MDCGPRHVIIKKGEHGAFMFNRDSIFFAPAFPLENVFDPTGAGDSFAGGFIGYLARTGDLTEANMRRAVMFGSAMGSFAVEKFSTERLMTLTRDELAARIGDLKRLVTFEEEISA
jgi:sugar/nucleoside kinase (ribokinase family)